jgi:ribA/ribD-fused uncharacterized protein
MNWEYMDENVVLFWSGVLSNWYKSDFNVDGVTYNCVEQYMMQQKAIVFGDIATAAAIMATKSPKNQKALGRAVSNFDATRWSACCQAEVYPGIYSKFKQNNVLQELLLSTGNRIIAEASPFDTVWGIGLAPDNPLALDQKNWRGTNYLGQLLMLAREHLRGDLD